MNSRRNLIVVWQTVLHLSSGKLVPFSFLHASELVFFIQFTICLLTVRSKLTPHNGILRETLITLLGIFGSSSSSVRPHVRFTSLQAKNFAIFQFFYFSVYGATLPFHACFTYLFCSRCISVVSWSRYSEFVSFQSPTLACSFYSTSRYSKYLSRSLSARSILRSFCHGDPTPSSILVGFSSTNTPQCFRPRWSFFPRLPSSSPSPATLSPACYWPSSSLACLRRCQLHQ